jgi:hypothetical protein
MPPEITNVHRTKLPRWLAPRDMAHVPRAKPNHLDPRRGFRTAATAASAATAACRFRRPLPAGSPAAGGAERSDLTSRATSASLPRRSAAVADAEDGTLPGLHLGVRAACCAAPVRGVPAVLPAVCSMGKGMSSSESSPSDPVKSIGASTRDSIGASSGTASACPLKAGSGDVLASGARLPPRPGPAA